MSHDADSFVKILLVFQENYPTKVASRWRTWVWKHLLVSSKWPDSQLRYLRYGMRSEKGSCRFPGPVSSNIPKKLLAQSDSNRGCAAAKAVDEELNDGSYYSPRQTIKRVSRSEILFARDWMHQSNSPVIFSETSSYENGLNFISFVDINRLYQPAQEASTNLGFGRRSFGSPTRPHTSKFRMGNMEDYGAYRKNANSVKQVVVSVCTKTNLFTCARNFAF